MSNLHEHEVIRKLEQLGEVTPGPEATRHALDRVRGALAVAPLILLPTKKWYTAKLTTVGAGVLLVAGTLAGWFFFSPAGDGPDINAVQSALKAPVSVSYAQTTRGAGGLESTIRLHILASGIWRAEKSDGSYVIVDSGKRQALFVNPAKREAVLQQDVNIPPITLYDRVKNLANDKSATALPGKKIDGTNVLGFAVKSLGQDVTLWVDPQTYLPVRIECELKDDDGKTASIVLDQFIFNKEMDAALFTLDPPPGYNSPGKGGEVKAAPDDAELKAPIITPLVGLGPLKFGMSRADIERILGKAEGKEVTNLEGDTMLVYGSRGLLIELNSNHGLLAITCLDQSLEISTAFAGKTDKGIALGASESDIIAAYGEPNASNTIASGRTLVYHQLQMSFSLANEKLVQLRFGRRSKN